MFVKLPPYDPVLYDGNHLEARQVDVLEPMMKIFRWAKKYYFFADISGWENLPKDRHVLLVGNHNGGLGTPDLPLLITAWHDRFKDARPLHMLAHDVNFIFRTTAMMTCLAGGLRATRANGLKVLQEARRDLLIYPGGGKEFFRPFTERYRVNFFGHKGFIRLALRAGVPIVPVVACGAHESLFIIASNRRLARALGLDKKKIPVIPLQFSFPLGLTLGLVPNIPTPTKVQIHFEKPFLLDEYGPEDADNDDALELIYEQVLGRMQKRMDILADSRLLPAFF